MLLKERYGDSFEIFLEMVDEAPCWAEERKCTVGVEVVLKGKEKEERMELPKRKFSKAMEDGSSRKLSSVGGQSDRKPSSSGAQTDFRKLSLSAEQMDYQPSSSAPQDYHDASSELIAVVPLLQMET